VLQVTAGSGGARRKPRFSADDPAEGGEMEKIENLPVRHSRQGENKWLIFIVNTADKSIRQLHP
jgi:hypothetical protein